jgi:hypothetical protein
MVFSAYSTKPRKAEGKALQERRREAACETELRITDAQWDRYRRECNPREVAIGDRVSVLILDVDKQDGFTDLRPGEVALEFRGCNKGGRKCSHNPSQRD